MISIRPSLIQTFCLCKKIIIFFHSSKEKNMDDLHNNCECVDGEGRGGMGTNSMPLDMQLISNIIPSYLMQYSKTSLEDMSLMKNT